MKTTLITTIVILYVTVLSIGYYIVEYSNINSIQLTKENKYLSDKVEQLINENQKLKDEIDIVKQHSDIKYYYLSITLMLISILVIVFFIIYYKTFKNTYR